MSPFCSELCPHCHSPGGMVSAHKHNWINSDESHFGIRSLPSPYFTHFLPRRNGAGWGMRPRKGHRLNVLGRLKTYILRIGNDAHGSFPQRELQMTENMKSVVSSVTGNIPTKITMLYTWTPERLKWKLLNVSKDVEPLESSHTNVSQNIGGKPSVLSAF